MDFATLHDVLDKLRCDKCKHHLSFFPIHSDPDYQNLCGRCSSTTPHTNHVRNEAYEVLAQFLKFPCRYRENGCDDEMVPTNVPDHEELCPYKTVRCPLAKSTDCTWEGPLPEVSLHCHDKHFELILTEDEFQIFLSDSHQQENLVETENTLFLVSRKFDASTNTLEYGVCHIEDDVDADNCSCEIRIRYGRRNLSIEMETTTFKEADYTKIFLGSLNTSTDTLSSVFGKISFGKIHRHEKKGNEEINREMLSVVKCSGCSRYSMPPIFHCVQEQIVLCPDCRPNHTCTACTENLQGTRNFSLDKLANWLDYPCRYEGDGCEFVSKPDLMTEHQRLCPYAPQDCPVKDLVECAWNGFRKNVTKHVFDDHHDIITNLGEVFFSVPSEETRVVVRRSMTKSAFRRRIIHSKIIQFANHLFRLTFAKTSHSFCWKMQIIGEFDKQFKYEIEVIDVNNNGRRLLMRQICSPLDLKEIYCNYKECCRFDTNQVDVFVSNRNLMYKVNIFK